MATDRLSTGNLIANRASRHRLTQRTVSQPSLWTLASGFPCCSWCGSPRALQSTRITEVPPRTPRNVHLPELDEEVVFRSRHDTCPTASEDPEPLPPIPDVCRGADAVPVGDAVLPRVLAAAVEGQPDRSAPNVTVQVSPCLLPSKSRTGRRSTATGRRSTGITERRCSSDDATAAASDMAPRS